MLATGHGQSEVPHLSLLGDGSHVQCQDLNPLWWNGYSAVKPHHQSITCQFQNEIQLNLNDGKKKKKLLPTLTHKKIKLKNLPSLGMNAPDQLNKLFPAHLIYHILRTFKNTNIKKKENIWCFTWTEQHLLENHHIENKSLLTAIQKRKKNKSVWHIDMEFSNMKNKVNNTAKCLWRTFFCCFSFCGMFFLFFFFEYFFLWKISSASYS